MASNNRPTHPHTVNGQSGLGVLSMDSFLAGPDGDREGPGRAPKRKRVNEGGSLSDTSDRSGPDFLLDGLLGRRSLDSANNPHPARSGDVRNNQRMDPSRNLPNNLGSGHAIMASLGELTKNDLRPQAERPTRSSGPSSVDDVLPDSVDSDRIIQRLIQIRDYISHANRMVAGMVGMPSSESNDRRMAKVRNLITELKEQETGYMQLLTNLLEVDDEGNPISNEQNNDDDTTIDMEEEDRDQSDESDVDRTNARPASEGATPNQPVTAGARSGQPQQRSVEGTAKELEDLRHQRDILRDVLAQQEELRAFHGRQIALLETERDPVSTDATIPNGQPSTVEVGQRLNVSASTSEPGRQRSSQQNGNTSRGGRVREDGARPVPELAYAADSQSSMSGSEDALMATAIPRELMDMRRRLDYLRRKQEELVVTESGSQSDTSEHPSESTGDTLQSLNRTRSDLTDRLSVLQEKKDQIDDLLEQLELLRDERTGQVVRSEDVPSTSSSQLQLAETKASASVAQETAEEAGNVLSMLESQKKLKKLKEVRQRLSHLRDMMAYYENMTQFIHEDGSHGDEEQGAVGGVGPVRRAESVSSTQEEGAAGAGPIVRPKKQRLSRKDAYLARQRLMEYGSGSSVTSDAESSGANAGPWMENHDLKREVADKRGSIDQLRDLVQLLQSGRALHELPQDKLRLLAGILEDEGPGAVEETSSLTSLTVSSAPGSEPGEVTLRTRNRAGGPRAGRAYDSLTSQQREITELSTERERLLLLQRQWERLNESLEQPRAPPGSPMTGEQTRRRGEAPVGVVVVDQSKPNRDTVTFQEPVATFVANDEVYENLRAERTWREELRQKKAEIASLVQKERPSNAYCRNQSGDNMSDMHSSRHSDAVGTLVSQEMGTSGATWGGSTEDTEMDERRDDEEEMEDTGASGGDAQVEEEEEEQDLAAGSPPGPLFAHMAKSALYPPRSSTNQRGFPLGLEARARHHIGGQSSSRANESTPYQQQQQLPYPGPQMPMTVPNPYLIGSSPGGFPANQQQMQMAFPSGNAQMSWGPQALQENISKLMTDMMSMQAQINATVSRIYSGGGAPSSQLFTPPYYPMQGYPPAMTMQALPSFTQQQVGQGWSHPGTYRGDLQHPQSSNTAVPPLDLSEVSRRAQAQAIGSRYANGSPGLREASNRNASRRPGPTTSQPASRNIDFSGSGPQSTSYRPGLSAGISGAGFDSASDVSSVASDLGDRRKGRDGRTSLERLVASGKRLLGEDFDVENFESLSRTFASNAGTSGARPSSNSRRPEVNISSRESSTEVVSEFDTLRETIYGEVATLISQNEMRPNFLIELFRELQHLSSDYLRQRALYMLHDLVTKSLTQEVLGLSTQGSRPQWRKRKPQEELDETPSESLAEDDDTDEDNYSDASMGKLYASALRRLEEKTAQLLGNYSALNQSGASPGSRPACGDGGKVSSSLMDQHHHAFSISDNPVDYVECASSASSMSTPSASPFGDSLGDTVIHLDKMLRDMEEQRAGEGATDPIPRLRNTSEAISDSSASDMAAPHVNTQQLEDQIKQVIHFLIPAMKDHQSEVLTSQLVLWTRDAVLERVMNLMQTTLARDQAVVRGDQEFSKFFYKQLAAQLTDALTKYEGKRLSSCMEDLMVDVSEMLFNELAFFRLVSDLDGVRSELTSDVEEDALEATLGLQGTVRQAEEEPGQSEEPEYSDEFDGEESQSDEEEEDEEEDDGQEEEEEPLEIHHEGKRGSLSVDLAPSETKPMNRIGSDEDEDDEDMLEEGDGEEETAVARSSPEGLLDAEEKDGNSTEKDQVKHEEDKDEETHLVEVIEENITSDDPPKEEKNESACELTVDQLPERLDLDALNGQEDLSGVLASLSGCPELAGDGNVLPAPSGQPEESEGLDRAPAV